MFYISENLDVNTYLDQHQVVTSGKFKELYMEEGSALEGVYLCYQLQDEDNKLYLGQGGITPDLKSKVKENDFYFDTTQNKKEYIFKNINNSIQEYPLGKNISGSSTQELVSVLSKKSLLETMIDLNFTSSWIPVDTIKRDNGLEVLIPKDYLPDNFFRSATLFLGFKDLIQDNSKVNPFLGIPLVNKEGNNILDREVNNSINFSFSPKGSLFNNINDSNIKKLESSDLNKETIEEAYTLQRFISEYNSYVSDKSTLGTGEVLGTNLNF